MTPRVGCKVSSCCQQEHPEWDVKDGRVLFQKVKESQPCKEIPAAPVINQTLGYARELERIV